MTLMMMIMKLTAIMTTATGVHISPTHSGSIKSQTTVLLTVSVTVVAEWLKRWIQFPLHTIRGIVLPVQQ